jgi:hypothetical protein
MDTEHIQENWRLEKVKEKMIISISKVLKGSLWFEDEVSLAAMIIMRC